MAEQIFAVGNASLATWVPQFFGQCERPPLVTIPRSFDELEVAAADGQGADGQGAETVFVSDHQTMTRDLEWAALLADRGRAVRCQSEIAATAAHDKAALKQILAARLIPTLPWRCANGRAEDNTDDSASCSAGGWAGRRAGGCAAPAGPVVVKRRNGTQSEGIRLAPPGAALAADEYAEPYRDGTEYSVNAFGHPAGLVILPPVWKGRTSQALVPPWMRTRLCAPGVADPAVASRLTTLTASIAAALDADAFFEVEFLVTDPGEVYVLEVNPRVSGTLRISALATGEPVFSWYGAPPAESSLTAIACAVEVPNPGSRRAVIPDLGLYATSRVTVAAADQAGLAGRVRKIAQADVLDTEAITALYGACALLEASDGHSRARDDRNYPSAHR